MAGEIHVIGPTGRTCYVHILDSVGRRWNGSSFETFAVGNYASYDVSVAEDGATGIYRADMPSGVTAGSLDVVLFIQAGGSPANGDRAVGAQSISWSGSSTSPVTVPLGSLTGSLMKAYIVRSGWRRTDMDTELYDCMTDTVLEMEQTFRFDQREKESTTTDTISAVGDYKINLESDFGHLVGVTLMDTDTTIPLRKISRQAYECLYQTPTGNTNTGYPEKFAIFANQIYIGPPPDRTSYQFRLIYSQRLTSTIDANTSPVPFSAQYREVLKDGTLRRLFKNVKQWDLADRFGNDYAIGLERAMALERRNREGSDVVKYFDL